MPWHDAFDKDNPPTWSEIESYIASSLWGELNAHLQGAYGVQPKLLYSACSMQPGWNVKYQKGGSALCTLYPMRGYFIALVVIGDKQTAEAELTLPTCGAYVRALYEQARPVMGRWLMIEVTDAERLRDAKALIAVRAKSVRASGKRALSGV